MIQINPNDKVIELKKFQSRFVLSKARYPAFVASWATGKSLCGIGRAMQLSKEYPNNLGVIFRKEYTDLRDSTLKDFENYTGIKVNSSRESKVGNSIIMFRHLEEINNIQNLNLGWFWIEQAEELDSDEQFFILFGRLRRSNCHHSGFITANTKGHNWIWKLWKQKTLEGSMLIEATTYDNSDVLPEDYLKSLDLLKVKKPHLYNRFVLNSWDDIDTVDNIIQHNWVEIALSKKVFGNRGVVVCDPARYGDDETVIYAMQGNKVIDEATYKQKSIMETAGIMMLIAKKNFINTFAVDVCGLGGGLADRLKELNEEVIEINSAEKSKDGKYRNIRAEMWATAADKFEMERVALHDDKELIEDLTQMKYKTIESSGRLQVESKEDFKKRMGRSPDRGDAFVMGLWAVEKAQLIDIIASQDNESENIRQQSFFRRV